MSCATDIVLLINIFLIQTLSNKYKFALFIYIFDVKFYCYKLW